MTALEEDASGRWFSETLHPDCRQRLRVGRVLHQSRTAFQDVLVFETPAFGRVLALDGIIQTTEGDEFCYHEMLAHAPILAHGAARSVLVVGGGDGGTLREVLRHGSVERATMVEIDRGVIDACRAWLPGLGAGAFDDPRAEVIVGDGAAFVAGTDRRFDVVIVDSTDPRGPSLPLFSDEFCRNCRAVLTEDGVVVCQTGVSFQQEDEARGTWRRLRRAFADAALYVTHVPTYGFGYMILGWGARSARARATGPAALRRRFEAAGIATRYYTPDVHAGAFRLPAYIEALKT